MSDEGEISLSNNAVRLAEHLVQVSEKGLDDPIGWNVILERFSASERAHMAEAAFELEQSYLVSISPSANSLDGISHIRPDYALHWLLDEDAFGYDTNADTLTLISLILENESLGQAPKLREKVNWPLRRFNPPFARIVQEFPKGRVSGEIQPDYPAMAVVVIAEDRVRLKQLRHRIERDLQASENDERDTSEPLIEALGGESIPKRRMSWFLSHPNWMGIGVVLTTGLALLTLYMQSDSQDWQSNAVTAVAEKPPPSEVEEIAAETARDDSNDFVPSKSALVAAFEVFDFDSSNRTTNEQARSMMMFLEPDVVLPTSRGAGATTGVFGEPDSNGVQTEVTIWKDSYDRANVYGIRFGLSDSAYWGCNDSYLEIVLKPDGSPSFVTDPALPAPCKK